MTPQSDQETWIPVTVIAEQLSVHRTTVYRAIQAGLLDAHRVGVGKGTLRVTRAAFDAYLAACRTNAATP